MNRCITKINELKPLLEAADHTDVKVAEGHTDMREFIAAMLSYYPWWIAFLFRIRAILVRILGLVRHSNPGKLTALRPEDVPLTPGETAAFFIVRFARENTYWVAESPPDKHLRAYIAVVVERLKGNRQEVEGESPLFGRFSKSHKPPTLSHAAAIVTWRLRACFVDRAKRRHDSRTLNSEITVFRVRHTDLVPEWGRQY